jgi:two-component system, cell cycle sensor histidine kinase and response regulator CckA
MAHKPDDQFALQSGRDQALVRLEHFERKLQAELLTRADMGELLQELQTAIEEVRVADEELAAQNDELFASREALEVERHRYQRLFDAAPDGYVVTDPAGKVLEANLAACELLNTSRKALAGKPLVVFLAPRDRAAFRSLVERVAAGERVVDWDVVLWPRGHSPVAATLTAAPEPAPRGLPIHLLWIARDVSARKATEEALRESEERLRHSQRLEAIGRLAGGIAHSFNNLLAAIAFHGELLSEGLGEGSPLRSHLEEVQRAVERAAALASQLLAFGRKQVLQPQALPVNEVLSELEGILAQLIGEHIKLEIHLDPKAGAIHADLGQFEQVILNLVTNARDAMPDGGKLTLETAGVEIGPDSLDRLELRPGRYVRLTVQDTGIGMTGEVRARLFEPFFTTKERHKGTGLGLATVYGIVRQSGGDVQVESGPGKGARFDVFLPSAPPEVALAGRPARRTYRRPAGGSEVVLLVEDADSIREPAREILEGKGYKVLAARDGAEALALAGDFREPIHLLVTDVIMPGMSGGQLAARLEPERPEMKVLFMSGYPEDAISRHGVLDARRSFLQKPFSPRVFLARVREVLDGAPSQKAD